MADVPFFTAAGLEVPIAAAGGGGNAPQLLGELARAIDGTLLSTASGVTRSLTLTTAPLTAGELAALEARVGGGRFVALGGWLMEQRAGLAPGGTVDGVVVVGADAWTPDQFTPASGGPDVPLPRFSVTLTVEW